MKAPKDPMDTFNQFMGQILIKDQQYVQKIKSQKELWQLFQRVYTDWQVENKAELTQKSPLLTAVKESLSPDARN